MPQWIIKREGPPGQFVTVVETYDDANGPVQDYVQAKQATDGVCYAADEMPPAP